MKTFTSIFHEEVIPMNEFKGEAEAHYAYRRETERDSGRHSKKAKDEYKADKKDNDDYRDKGSGPATSKKDAEDRKKVAANTKKYIDSATNMNDKTREMAKKHGLKIKRESFLPEIELI